VDVPLDGNAESAYPSIVADPDEPGSMVLSLQRIDEGGVVVLNKQ
jgi:hypothetical protein